MHGPIDTNFPKPTTCINEFKLRLNLTFWLKYHKQDEVGRNCVLLFSSKIIRTQSKLSLHFIFGNNSLPFMVACSMFKFRTFCCLHPTRLYERELFRALYLMFIESVERKWTIAII